MSDNWLPSIDIYETVSALFIDLSYAIDRIFRQIYRS